MAAEAAAEEKKAKEKQQAMRQLNTATSYDDVLNAMPDDKSSEVSRELDELFAWED